MDKVKCNWCDWEGTEDEIIYNEKEVTEKCPKCKSEGFLMDIN